MTRLISVASEDDEVFPLHQKLCCSLRVKVPERSSEKALSWVFSGSYYSMLLCHFLLTSLKGSPVHSITSYSNISSFTKPLAFICLLHYFAFSRHPSEHIHSFLTSNIYFPTIFYLNFSPVYVFLFLYLPIAPFLPHVVWNEGPLSVSVWRLS